MQRDFDLDAFLPYLVSVLARRLSLGFAEVYGERFGITIAQWRVIAHLAGHAKVSVREIHERVALDKVAVSRAASGLEASGHVSKHVNPVDRRLLELRLTAKGMALFREMSQLALTFEDEALSPLTPGERDDFRRTIAKLVAAVHGPRAGGDSA